MLPAPLAFAWLFWRQHGAWLLVTLCVLLAVGAASAVLPAHCSRDAAEWGLGLALFVTCPVKAKETAMKTPSARPMFGLLALGIVLTWQARPDSCALRPGFPRAPGRQAVKVDPKALDTYLGQYQLAPKLVH